MPKRMERINFYCPNRQLRALKRTARKKEVSMSEVLRYAIEYYLQAEKDALR